jgi:four helix bundle protein
MIEGQSAIGYRQSDVGEPGHSGRPGQIASYRDLRIWNLSVEPTVEVCELTKAFPRSELYGLTSHLRRAATSVAANIAEGYGRDNTGSYVQFLRIAQGSLKELETHINVAKRIGFLDMAAEEALLDQPDNIGKILRSLIRKRQRVD